MFQAHIGRFAALCLVSLAVLLGGCSSTPKLGNPVDEGQSIVFGHIDMSEAPSHLHRVWMKRLRPLTDTPYYGFWVVEGTFFRDNVPQGTYKFTKFGGYSSWKKTDYTYNFPAQGKGEIDRQINKPGIYYVGSYKYKKINTGLFKPDEFDLEAVSSPSELELLRKILPYAKHDYWKGMIDRRIKELEK